MRTAFITGTAGFIGFHLAKSLLEAGWNVTGYDGLTDYYDVTLKKSRHQILNEYPHFNACIGMLEDSGNLQGSMTESGADIVVHLAAQAGVRYSIDNPRAYIDSNLVGFYNVLESAKKLEVNHLLLASTSSVYGSNTKLPFRETDDADSQLSLYAATKKSNENLAHSYAHLWGVPTTALRFFTVYGPWGRPDLALFKFVQSALNGQEIDVYNYGQMARDFTYVDDLVRAISLLIDKPPVQEAPASPNQNDTLSNSAPFRTVNIGNGKMVPLMRFIRATEQALGQKIAKRMLPLQAGDVPSTWADTDLLHSLTGFRPNTEVEVGVQNFVDWYLNHYAEQHDSKLPKSA